MIEHPTNSKPPEGQTPPPGPVADEHISTLSNLLRDLDESPQSGLDSSEREYQDQLVRGRLGIASSLFTALRAKHPPTAAHSLRVALGCSAWSLLQDFTDEQRADLEVAALLHDIGKIGVPDSVLLKPGRLDADEVLLMERHRRLGREILKGCCASNELLGIVYHCTSWYDGRKRELDRKGDDIPFAARMIAIVDAYDSMTTDHVYRRAMSRERAMAELFEHAGTQFDPHQVKEFCGFISSNQVKLEAQVARRWLQDLDSRAANMTWELNQVAETDFPDDTRHDPFTPFHGKLLETMHDGVVYVDSSLCVLHWNRGAERITGLAAESLLGQRFDPAILRMRDENGEFITEENCPVAAAAISSVQTFRRLSITGRNDKVQLNVQLAPVMNRTGSVRGVAMLMHDASSQATLEERVQALRERATQDPLTQVANRAEFDRMHEEFISQHLAEDAPCSLIICDIDHFKNINDNFGHQAGDDVLIRFAALLRSHSRGGDLVARYGGEEFCILCAECDNAVATRRAEEIRAALCNMAQPAIDNQCITSSFGVTELQGGDTPETMLRRADRALYQAKDAGRNRVVQLGSGLCEEEVEKPLNWLARLLSSPPELTMQQTLITAVPLKVTAEKLKGFVADHHAEIVTVEENQATIKIDGQNTPLLRRVTDRAVPFLIELKFAEARITPQSGKGGSSARTLIKSTIQPLRKRDRRRRDAGERAKQLLVSLKSYFMAYEHTDATANRTVYESNP